jgi:hypothetical protein
MGQGPALDEARAEATDRMESPMRQSATVNNIEHGD